MSVRRRFPVTRVGDISISVHLTWFPVLALVTAVAYTGFRELFPELAPVATGLVAACMGLAFFICLTLHELAHAVVANRLGVGVRSIVLFMFGGVAEIDREAATPGGEFAIALAGPAFSVVLASAVGIAQLGLTRVAPWALPLEALLFGLAFLNLGVALFNLVPALPLDGGRILRAGLWHLTADRARATRISGGGGRVLALLVAAGGAASAWVGHEPLGLWYVAMGGFLWLVARAASRRRPPEPIAFDREQRAHTGGRDPRPAP